MLVYLLGRGTVRVTPRYFLIIILIYFNTTACVGSRLRSYCSCSSRNIISIQLLVSVRANHAGAMARRAAISIQLLVSVRVLCTLAQSGSTIFQYNCLCRFEQTAEGTDPVGNNFNTTACVGSSVLSLPVVFLRNNFNTTACVGSRIKKT